MNRVLNFSPQHVLQENENQSRKSGLGNGSVLFLVILSFMICAGIGALLYKRYAPENVKDRVEEAVTPVAEAVGSAFGWVKHKIAAATPRYWRRPPSGP